MNCKSLKTLNLKNFKISNSTTDRDLVFQNINPDKCKLITDDKNIKKLFYK